MMIRLVAHWPSDDILPALEDFTSARAAVQRYRQLMRAGMSSVSIFAVNHGIMSRLSPTRLKKLSEAEPRLPRLVLTSARKTIASALLGICASALPNAFGDFGVVSHGEMLRAARSSRLSGPRTAPDNRPHA
ncbi:hypothetical protein BH11PSE3_BH11PSE3_25600 [soil metagenome]